MIDVTDDQGTWGPATCCLRKGRCPPSPHSHPPAGTPSDRDFFDDGDGYKKKTTHPMGSSVKREIKRSGNGEVAQTRLEVHPILACMLEQSFSHQIHNRKGHASVLFSKVSFWDIDLKIS